MVVEEETGIKDGDRSSDRVDRYNPSFVQPYRVSINIARFIVNSTELSMPNNYWVIDSAADAFITLHKSDLCSYVEQQIGGVKGFGEKVETAYSKRSLTLTDASGNRITLNDVCYVPSSQDHILSLMKFRRDYKADF